LHDPLAQESLLRFFGKDAILHLRTKRSHHQKFSHYQEFGSRWFEELLDSLLGDPTPIERILKSSSSRATLELLMLGRGLR
jgi:hypothetical protein